jgi:hypothetical protein
MAIPGQQAPPGLMVAREQQVIQVQRDLVEDQQDLPARRVLMEQTEIRAPPVLQGLMGYKVIPGLQARQEIPAIQEQPDREAGRQDLPEMTGQRDLQGRMAPQDQPERMARKA